MRYWPRNKPVAPFESGSRPAREPGLRVVHFGTAELPSNHPEYSTVHRHCDHPGRWVVNIARAQIEHEGICPQILVKVPGARNSWRTDISGVPVYFIPVPRFLRGKTAFFLERRILASAAMRLCPDIVHAHGTEESNALAALCCPVPKVLTLQGCFFLLNKKFPLRFFSRAWIVERLERRTIPRFRHLIAKSQYILDSVRMEFPGVEPHLVPNTYDPQLESVCISKPRERHMVFVGSLAPWKGVHLMIDALRQNFSRLPDFTLDICGDRPEVSTGYEGRMKRDLIAMLGARVRFHGIVPAKQLFDIVSACRLLVAPSIEDMFGNQAIESLMCGTHVLTIEGNAIADHVRTFGNGTVSTPEKLAGDLARLLQNPHDLIEAQKAKSAIISCISPKITARKHAEIYSQIVAHQELSAMANSANPANNC